MHLDEKITCAIHDLAGRYYWLDQLMVFFARDLLWAQILLPVGFFLVYRSVWAGVLLGCGLFTQILTLVIQEFIDRKRPFQSEHLHPLIELRIKTKSFPSGHASLSWGIGLLAALFFFSLSWWIPGVLCILGAILITFSRVYAGLHYLSDVLVGTLIGVGLAALLFYVFV